MENKVLHDKYLLEFYVPIYEWYVRVKRIRNVGKTHKFEFIKEVIPEEFIDEVKESIESGGKFGNCFSEKFRREADLLICAENFSNSEYANILSHETSHLIDKILEVSGVEDGEARAYLTGFIYEIYRENKFI